MADTKEIMKQIQTIGGSVEGNAKTLKKRLDNITEDAPLTFDAIYKMTMSDLRQALKQRNSKIHCDETVEWTEKENLQLQLLQCLLKRRGEYATKDENESESKEMKDIECEEKMELLKPKKGIKKSKRSSMKGQKKIDNTPKYMYIVNETRLVSPFKLSIIASVNSKVQLRVGKLNTAKNIQSVIKQLNEVKQMRKLQTIESKGLDTVYLNEIRSVIQKKFNIASVALSLQNIQIKTKKSEDSLVIKNGSSTLIGDQSYIGDLIVCVPIRTFEDGQLIIDPNGGNSIISFAKWIKTESYDKERKEFTSLYWAAIHKQYKYKLKDVSKGYRMTIQYGIHSVTPISETSEVVTIVKEKLVKQLVEDYTLME